MQGRAYQSNLVATDHLQQLFAGFHQITVLPLISLETNFYSAVILEKFNLILP